MNSSASQAVSNHRANRTVRKSCRAGNPECAVRGDRDTSQQGFTQGEINSRRTAARTRASSSRSHERVRAPKQTSERGPHAVKFHVVHFRLINDRAQHVFVAGTFNDWKPEENPLRRSAFGEWETTLLLAPGTYEYRFLIDGEWAPDPLARRHIVTPFGSVHAVLHLRGEAESTV